MCDRTWDFRVSVPVAVLSYDKKNPLIKRKGFIKPYRNLTELLGKLNIQLMGWALGTTPQTELVLLRQGYLCWDQEAASQPGAPLLQTLVAHGPSPVQKTRDNIQPVGSSNSFLYRYSAGSGLISRACQLCPGATMNLGVEGFVLFLICLL